MHNIYFLLLLRSLIALLSTTTLAGRRNRRWFCKRNIHLTQHTTPLDDLVFLFSEQMMSLAVLIFFITVKSARKKKWKVVTKLENDFNYCCVAPEEDDDGRREKN
jgi:hypothetical protein